MKIGTDVSIAECRCSGYMVIDFGAGKDFSRKLIKKGVLDKDCPVTLSVSNPEAWNDSGKPIINTDIPIWNLSPHDTEYSWNDLMEFLNYSDRRASIASTCDWENCAPNFDNPNEYDLLHLASDIHCCYSLATC